MEEYLSTLNDQQRDAVLYCDGPQLVIAGAGSGKTRVLTHKILHLLHLGYEPWRILALTFTNKAAHEMRSRIEQLVGSNVASKLWMGTFHSIFARILRLNADRIGFKPSFTIYDTSDSKSLVKTIIRDMGLDEKIYKPSTVLNAISTAKNALISPEDYANLRDLTEADKNARRPRICEIYRNYRDRCVVAGAMDFDDLLYYTNVLLRDNPDVLHHYQEYFRYILVDEYQDTNFAQHVIVTQLSRINRHLSVVGDDAQSIYSFRGANIRNILDLKKSYPTLSTFKLERNYRSTQNIINAAGSLIEKNVDQIPKKVYSENSKGSKIEVVKSFSDYEEAYLVAARVSQVKTATHDSYDEFAILYRTNAQSRILEEALRKRNIPYRIYGGLSFYQRKEVKDAVSYFRLSINPDDEEALKRIINFPARGIGETTLNKLTRTALDNNTSIWNVICDLGRFNPGVNSGTAKKLNAFRTLIESMIESSRNKNAYDAARFIIERTGMLAMFMSDSTPESISRRENIEELLAGAKEFTQSRFEEGEENATLNDFLADISLATDQDLEKEGEGERITLMTVHAAKGLEFNNVFIVGIEEELFPSAMSMDSPQQIEEERRLLYVAITRARNFCMMSYASSRFRNGQTVLCKPSRFLGDIDSEYLRLTGGADFGSSYRQNVNPVANYKSQYNRLSSSARSISSIRTPAPSTPASAQTGAGTGRHSASSLRPGMIIEHSRFGRGTIRQIDTSMTDDRIVVEFDNTGSKALMLKYAQFEIIE